MAHKYEELQAMTDQELIAIYNQTAPNVSTGLQWFADELHRRALDREAVVTRNLTRWALIVSIISAVAAVAAVVVAVITLAAL